MADVTGVIGSDVIELDNAATEATLKQLLAAVQGMNKSIISLKGTGGGSAASGAAAGVAGMAALAGGIMKVNPLVKILSTSFGLLSGVVTGVTGAIGFLIGSITPTLGALTKFGEGLLDGRGGLSEFYGALTQLPGPLGFLAGIAQKLAQMQEAELDVYRKITNAGVNFGGQLTNLRQSALSMGLTLDQFGSLMANNSRIFSMMGGSANEGAETFTKLAIALRNDPVGRQLRALGYTAEQSAEGMASYIAVTGGRTRDELKNTKEIVTGTGEYLNQLDRLADITGQTREEQEKQLKQSMFEADVQMTMANMSKEDREAFSAAMEEAGSLYGQAGRDVVLAQAQGRAVTGEAGKMFTATAGNAAQTVASLQAIAKQYGRNSQEFINASNKSRLQAQEGLSQFSSAAYSLSPGLREMSDVTKRVAQDQMSGLTNKKALDEADANREAKKRERENSAAAQAAEVENGFKDMQAALYGALKPAIEFLTPMVNELATEFMGFVQKHMPEIKAGITDTITKIKSFFVENWPSIEASFKSLAEMLGNFTKNLFSESGREKIKDDILYYFKLMLIEIKQGILPSFLYDEDDAKAERAQLDKQKQDEKEANAAKANAAKEIKAETESHRSELEARYVRGPRKSENVAAVPMTTPAAAGGGIFTGPKSGYNVQLHGTEAVVTPDQMSNIIDSASKKTTAISTEYIKEDIQRLNATMTEILASMKQSVDQLKQNVAATKSLNRNLFPS